MRGYVWFLEKVVTIDEKMMDRMEKEVDDMSGEWCNYVLSCRWDDEHNCIKFFPDGPWEC